MKKTLLLATLATALAATSAAAYDVVDGFTCQNIWEKSLIKGNYEKTEYDFIKNGDYDRARTMTIADIDGVKKMIVGYSHKISVGEELNSGSAHIVIIDMLTGKYEGCVQLTCDGKTIDDLLVINSVGTDDFGNVWFCPYRENFQKADGTSRPVPFYIIKDFKTGVCENIFTLTLPDTESEQAARTDYYDVVGDVTGQKAGTVVMTAGCEGSTSACVFGWQRDQGSDKWDAHLSDGGYYSMTIDETYPAGATTFNYGSMVYMVRDDEHTGSLFYVDGFTTLPTLYNTEGAPLEMLTSLDDNNQDCKPIVEGCNGVHEFSIGDTNFIAWPLSDHNKGTQQLGIMTLGEGGSFAGMKKLWTVPEEGLGSVSDGGMRIHCIQSVPVTDAAGKHGVYLSHYRCRNGFGTYLIAENGFSAGVNDVIADEDVNAPVEYYNLQGVRISEPAAGQLVIKRQGTKATKEFIR